MQKKSQPIWKMPTVQVRMLEDERSRLAGAALLERMSMQTFARKALIEAADAAHAREKVNHARKRPRNVQQDDSAHALG